MAWGSGRYAPEASAGRNRNSVNGLSIRDGSGRPWPPPPATKIPPPHGSKRTVWTLRPGHGLAFLSDSDPERVATRDGRVTIPFRFQNFRANPAYPRNKSAPFLGFRAAILPAPSDSFETRFHPRNPRQVFSFSSTPFPPMRQKTPAGSRRRSRSPFRSCSWKHPRPNKRPRRQFHRVPRFAP